MADPPPEPAGAEFLHSSGAATATVEEPCPAPDVPCILAAGGRWHDYDIEGPALGPLTRAYEATEVSTMEKVLITGEPLTNDTERRRAVWENLCRRIPAEANVLRCLKSIEADGCRYEVMIRPPAMTLREWIDCNKADEWIQKHFLQQFLVAVEALHAAGIAHLNIRPETIYLEDQGGRMGIVLGGLDAAILYDHPKADPAGIDPFYAPPESVEPAGLPAGRGRCAWDWWGVGRVMQELVLGGHVMTSLFGHDVIRRPTPQLREQARALLLEQEPPGVRAGGVEVKEAGDPLTTGMLRGLLTSAREARWGGDAVRCWLAKEEVANHYDLPRGARFYSWQGRGLTLAEAVKYFRTGENWAIGEENIFAPGNPETLAHFLSTVPAHTADWEKLQAIQLQVESAGWNGVPLATRRAITTAVAWLTLGPQPGALIIQGRRIDAAGLAELLNSSQNPGNGSLVIALMSAPGLALITPLDPAAAQALTFLAETAPEALRRAEEYHWVEPDDQAGQTRVLQLALEHESTVARQVSQIRAAYASSDDPVVAGLLADPKPARWIQVLLILTSRDPQRFGLVTRAEYARRHFAGMEARCRQLCAAVFWRRLRRMLLAGGPCSGEWKIFLSLGAIFAVLGVAVARDAATTGALLAGLAGWRGTLGWRVRQLARRLDPDAPPWNWRDGPARGLTELQRICPGVASPTLAALSRQLAEAEAAKAALLPADTPPRKAPSPRLIELWVGLATCVFGCVLGSSQLVKDYRRLVAAAGFPEGRPGAVTTADASLSTNPTPAKPPVDPLLAVPGLTPEIVAKIRRGEYEIIHDGFGATLHGPITPWNFRPPATPAALPVVAQGIATPVQRASAQVSGELLIHPFGHKPINALIAVRVPVEQGVALLVYNAREHTLFNRDLLLLREPPAKATWYQLDHLKIIYLGVPTEMADEISRAMK